VSTVQSYVASAPALPAGSVARTSNVCDPSLRPEYVFGLVQEAKEPESSLHSKVLPGSLAVKAKLGVESFVSTAGFDVNVANGATVSIVQP
jgi:hypothetical protein